MPITLYIKNQSARFFVCYNRASLIIACIQLNAAKIFCVQTAVHIAEFY